MADNNHYHHLEARPGSSYRQLFVKGKRIRAEVLFRQTVGEEARTPEEVAEDYRLPVEAVREAIDYCKKHPEVLQGDRDKEEAGLRQYFSKHPPVLPPDYVPDA